MKIQSGLFVLSAAMLAACGGSDSGNAAADNSKPSDFPPRRALYAAPTPPDALEQTKVEAGKTYYSRYTLLDGVAQSQRFVVDGHSLYAHMRTGDGALAHVDARTVPQGFADRSVTGSVNGVMSRQNVRSYQGFRSGVMVLSNDTDGARFVAPFGYETPLAQLPAAGKATYRGMAFNRHEQGDVRYHVDFAKRTGHGEITGLSRYGTIALHDAAYASHWDALNQKTDYRNMGEASAANGQKLRYSTTFYGDKAEELLGELVGSHDVIGFHGVRDTISE